MWPAAIGKDGAFAVTCLQMTWSDTKDQLSSIEGWSEPHLPADRTKQNGSQDYKD